MIDELNALATAIGEKNHADADNAGRVKNWTLDIIDVASPCSASWDAMPGDDVTRFCGKCKLHVYNLSGMTRAEAETFVRTRAGRQGNRREGEGRLCVRFFRRADGTVMTRDCPVGLRAIRLRIARLAAAAAALLGFVTFGGWAARAGTNAAPDLTTAGLLARAYEWLFPPEYDIVGSYYCDPDSIPNPDPWIDSTDSNDVSLP